MSRSSPPGSDRRGYPPSLLAGGLPILLVVARVGTSLQPERLCYNFRIGKSDQLSIPGPVFPGNCIHRHSPMVHSYNCIHDSSRQGRACHHHIRESVHTACIYAPLLYPAFQKGCLYSIVTRGTCSRFEPLRLSNIIIPEKTDLQTCSGIKCLYCQRFAIAIFHEELDGRRRLCYTGCGRRCMAVFGRKARGRTSVLDIGHLQTCVTLRFGRRVFFCM